MQSSLPLSVVIPNYLVLCIYLASLVLPPSPPHPPCSRKSGAFICLVPATSSSVVWENKERLNKWVNEEKFKEESA